MGQRVQGKISWNGLHLNWPMLQSDSDDCAVEARLISEPTSAEPASVVQSIRLDWDHLLRQSRLEPIIRAMSPDQRRHERFHLPHVVGYLGKAHASRPHQIANISVGGFCMVSDEIWMPGTEMPITLQRENWDGEESEERVTVRAVVVRRENSQVGFSIAFSAGEDSIAFLDAPYDALWISKRTMARFLEDLKKPKPPRFLPFPNPEAPLPLVERTQRLIELARSHSLSKIPEGFCSKF